RRCRRRSASGSRLSMPPTPSRAKRYAPVGRRLPPQAGALPSVVAATWLALGLAACQPTATTAPSDAPAPAAAPTRKGATPTVRPGMVIAGAAPDPLPPEAPWRD